MSNSSNVVLSFPRDRIVREQYAMDKKDVINGEDRDKTIRRQKMHINTVLEENASFLAARLGMSGIDIGKPEFQKDFALTVEFLRAAIYKSFGIVHPLHEPMAEMIKAITNTAKTDSDPPPTAS